MGDAIPIAGHGLESIIQSERRIVEMFELLQHRIRQAGEEGVAAEHQQRQPVGMGERCGVEEIARARSGGCGGEHEAAAQMIFCVSSSGEAHALLILPTVEGQLVAHRIKCLAQTGDVAVTENTKTAATNARALPIDLDELVGKPTHDRLRCGQSQILPAQTVAFPLAPLDGAIAITIRILQPVANRLWKETF